jgi:hypothetical protein
MPAKHERKEPAEAAPAEDVEATGGGGAGTDDERRERISVAAYYNAERRGFDPGGERDDWLEAERQVDGRGPEKGATAEASLRQSGEARDGAAGAARPDFPDLNEAGIEHIEPDEVQKWARRLKVPAPRLREAIQRVGPVVSDVKQFLENSDARS